MNPELLKVYHIDNKKRLGIQAVHNNIPDVIELTYINKEYFNNIVPPFNQIPFPISGLDYPNHPDYNDIILDTYPFVL